jgi:hypothetical protein
MARKAVPDGSFVRQIARQREIRNAKRAEPGDRRFAWATDVVPAKAPRPQAFDPKRVAPAAPHAAPGTKAPASVGREEVRERIEKTRVANREPKETKG